MKEKSPAYLLGAWICFWLSLPACHETSGSSIDEQIRLGRDLTTAGGAVACVDRYGAEEGAKILAQGGNAVDAAVTVALVLAVTHPAAGNLGGGGFMIVRAADGREVAIDYREAAPSSVGADLFLDDEGNYHSEWIARGHRAVGIPGTVAGLFLAHRNFGSLPWSELVQPAIRLAADGIVVDEDLSSSLSAVASILATNPAARRVFLDAHGRAPPPGDLLRQPDLAGTLRRLAEGGADSFYSGRTAVLIAADMARHGGLMTLADLAGYQAVMREPVSIPVGESQLLAMPPPSSSGVALGQILGVLQRRSAERWRRNSISFVHLYAEAARRAFADRAIHLADPDHVQVSVVELLSDGYLDAMARSIRLNAATPSDRLGPSVTLAEGTQTTHFSIVDQWGMAVANTYTLEQSYGAKVVAAGTGILLNNELGDFNRVPGVTNQKGFIGTLPNQAAPGKRPLSSMSPVVAVRDGKAVLVAGSPGGRTIINTIGLIVHDILVRDRDPGESVSAPRFHHQWFPDRLVLEEAGDSPALRRGLETLGHEVVTRKEQGDAHVIFIDSASDLRRAIADRRIDGWVGVADLP